MKRSELVKLIKEVIKEKNPALNAKKTNDTSINESKISPIEYATKEIARMRAHIFPKLNEEELWEFGKHMYKFFKDYKN